MSDLTETIERCLTEYNRHDAAAFASFFATDGSLCVVALGEVSEGRHEIEAAMHARWQVLDYQLQKRGLYESGSDVWLEWTMTGTHVGELMGVPPTQRPFELLGCSHFTVGADGLIVRDLVYFDSATLLTQLGILPELETSPK